MMSRSCMPFTPSLMHLSFHATNLMSPLWASSHALHLRVFSSSEVEISSRDILPCDTSALLAESKTSSSTPLASSPERTLTLPTDTVCEWTNFVPALASDLTGDLPWDPLPLPDPEPNSDELDELDRLSLDPHLDAKLLLEDEPDCELCREGDLARLYLDGEHTAEEEVRGRPLSGSASASLSICVGAVEVEADRPVLTVVAAPLPVLRMIASFKMSSAFLWLLRGGTCAKPRP